MKEKNYLPLLDLSSKSLSLRGRPFFKPDEVKDILAHMGIHDPNSKPVEKNHLIHAHWCSVLEGKCTCKLHNHSKPAQTRVRIECTRAHLKPILSLASQVQSNGGREITNVILDCIEPQTRIDPKDRTFLFTYPTLKTRWNRGLGYKSIVTERTATTKGETNHTSDQTLEMEMEELRLQKLQLEAKLKEVQVYQASNEYFEKELSAVVEWQEPTEEEENLNYGPSLVTVSEPILFKPYEEPPDLPPLPNLIEESVSNLNLNNDDPQPEKEAPVPIDDDVQTQEREILTPMIEKATTPDSPEPIKPLSPKKSRITFGIHKLEIQSPKSQKPILKPLKSIHKYQRKSPRTYPYQGRPLFISQNQFGNYNQSLKPKIQRENTFYDLERLRMLEDYIVKEEDSLEV